MASYHTGHRASGWHGTCPLRRTNGGPMVNPLWLLSLVTAPAGSPSIGPVSVEYRPRVEVWTDRGDSPYASGQGVRVHFRADRDAFVTILRVDTDGRVRVLFPREPWEDNFARGGREYEVQSGNDRDAFYIDDYPGVGYLFAVASADPFVYDGIQSNEHWDYRMIADGRVRGDPYVALTDVAQRIVPDGYSDWDYDVAPYYVQQHYDYPRFLCYDCHTYVSYPYWSPYDYSCVRFRIVVFDDPYYYPYQSYGGTRVAFTRPFRPEPRFIFKDRQASELFITRVPQRPVNDDRRREVGVRGRDLGGSIPPPNIQQRPRPITGGEALPGERPRPRPITGDPPHNGDDESGRRRPDRQGHPDHPDHPDHPEHPDRPDHRDRPDRPDHPEQRDGFDRTDRPTNPSTPARPERRERPDRPPEDVRPDLSRPDRVRTEPPRVIAPDQQRVEPRRPPE